jgi:hypothetical protein
MAPILCYYCDDYCDAVASMFFPRRGPRERGCTCPEHEDRAKSALGAHGDCVAGILPGRPRFEELDLVAMLARWGEYRVPERPAA